MTTSVTLSLGYVAVYVALAGVASFIEKPAGRGFGAFQFNTRRQARGFVIMGIYIVMIGVGAFLEKPALKGLTATQLNALMGIAMTAVAGVALAVKGPRLPMTKRTLGAVGVGIMIGHS
jgi:hypothetical protein